MKIRRASVLGFCFGVRNAISLAEKLIGSSTGHIYSLGELVHNKTLVEKYSREGLRVIGSEENVPAGTVLLRAHGVTPAVEESLREKGFSIVDGTCPLVKRNQLACQEARTPVILFCKKGHDEAVGIAGYARFGCYAVENLEDIDRIPVGSYVLIVQTTFPSDKLASFCEALKGRGFLFQQEGSGICPASIQRRKAVEQLAKETDAIVVVGDSNSANSKALYALASSIVPHAFLVSGPEMVTREMASFPVVGLTAGASVSDEIIQAVEDRLLHLAGENSGRETCSSTI